MKKISELFVVHRGKSGLFTDYEPGPVAYIGNSKDDNAVVGFVTPLPTDKVCTSPAIVVSAFGESTVQLPPFVACSRAGNGLVVLEPRTPMATRELAYFAAYINQTVSWRFNWYRQITVDRLRPLILPDAAPTDVVFSVKEATPPVAHRAERPHWKPSLREVPLDEIFDLRAGDYHALNALRPGAVPVVSSGDVNNGVAGYFEVEYTYQNRLTIALNGSTLTTKYHPYTFAAKDDVAVCIPRKPIRLTTQLFLQVMINRDRWRYSYYRKCYLGKLRRFRVMLPATNSGLDEDMMQSVIEATPYWDYLNQQLLRKSWVLREVVG